MGIRLHYLNYSSHLIRTWRLILLTFRCLLIMLIRLTKDVLRMKLRKSFWGSRSTLVISRDLIRGRMNWVRFWKSSRGSSRLRCLGRSMIAISMSTKNNLAFPTSKTILQVLGGLCLSEITLKILTICQDSMSLNVIVSIDSNNKLQSLNKIFWTTFPFHKKSQRRRSTWRPMLTLGKTIFPRGHRQTSIIRCKDRLGLTGWHLWK